MDDNFSESIPFVSNIADPFEHALLHHIEAM